MNRPLHAVMGLSLALFLVACGGDGPTDVDTPDAGVTTPSSIPEGDYPPIPRPASVTGTDANASDTLTTIEPLATNFRPPLRAITGTWSVGQAYAGQFQKTNTIRTCLYGVYSGRASSDDIVYASRGVECPLVEGGAYWRVVYPGRGRYLERWLNRDDFAFRRFLVRDGAVVPGTHVEVLLDEWDEGPFGQYWGDLDRSLVGRAGCLLDGTGLLGIDPCVWWIITNATVTREPLSSLPYLRKDVYWEKVGASEVVQNGQTVASEWTFSRSWTEGVDSTETEEFGESVSAKGGLSYQGLGAEVSGTLSQTFGSSVTVKKAVTVSQSFTMTVKANTTAVFELWNLTERYRFVNEDGTPFEDPNYRFSLTDLTRQGTLATAWTSTEFPND